MLISLLREPPSNCAQYDDMNSLSCHRLQIVVSSILSCRMLLRIRDYGKRTVVGDTGLSANASVMSAVDAPLRFADGGSDIE